MSFALASLEPIRSVSQRALASQWDRLSAGRPFPALTEFKPELDEYDARQLVVWSIEGEGRQLKFRALYQGENVAGFQLGLGGEDNGTGCSDVSEKGNA